MTWLQELYGRNPGRLGRDRDAEDERPAQQQDPTLCADSTVDALFTVTIRGRQRTYAFKGELYWRLADGGVMASYPRRIAARWGGVPSHLDTVLVYEPRPGASQTLFFFKVTVDQLHSVPVV